MARPEKCEAVGDGHEDAPVFNQALTATQGRTTRLFGQAARRFRSLAASRPELRRPFRYLAILLTFTYCSPSDR